MNWLSFWLAAGWQVTSRLAAMTASGAPKFFARLIFKILLVAMPPNIAAARRAGCNGPATSAANHRGKSRCNRTQTTMIGTEAHSARERAAPVIRFLHDPRGLVAPIAVAEQPLVELAGRQPRQLGFEIDRGR